MDQSEDVIEQPVTEDDATSPEAPEVAPEPEPAPAPEPEPAPAPEPDTQPMSRRESLRIQKLVSQLKQQAPPAYQPSKGLDYAQQLEADPETIQQLEADRSQAANRAYADGVAQANTIQFHTRLEIDAPRVEKEYPILDKRAQEFNPAVADAINTMYLSATGYNSQTGQVANPNLRYADYVESFMELVEATATTKAQASSQNIARQAATTALRPDGTAPKRMNLNQAPGAMTDAELKAVIAQSLPK